MATTMRENKGISKLKVVGIATLAAGALAGGGYTFGAAHMPAVSAADSPQINGNINISQAFLHSNDALIVSAVNFYQGQQDKKLNLAYLPERVKNIQTVGLNARASIDNSDSGAVAYLHYSPASKDNIGGWQVVLEGNGGLDQATQLKYGMPTSWLNPNDF